MINKFTNYNTNFKNIKCLILYLGTYILYYVIFILDNHVNPFFNYTSIFYPQYNMCNN